MYTSGGDDLEYAVPTNTSLNAFSPQFGGEALKGAGGMPIVSANTAYAEHSVGEVFTSVKQLLNRFQPIKQQSAIGASTGVTVWPWFSGITYQSGATGGILGPLAGGDTFSLVSPMYAFFRGGARIGAYTTTAGSTDRITGFLKFVAGGAAYIATYAFDYVGTSYGWQSVGVTHSGVGVSDSNNGVSSWLVPYYNRTQCSFMFQNTTTSTILGNNTVPEVELALGFTSSAAVQLLRSFKDEFQLSYFLGAPPLFISTT